MFLTFCKNLWSSLARHPRRWLALLALACLALLGFGLYLQHVLGLQPCPLCIVQRYALIGVALAAASGAAVRGPTVRAVCVVLTAVLAAFGAAVAARQSWLQWYPPEVLICGRDFFGMIEAFPLRRVIPMLFRGTGDCTKIDWTFLGLSIANWSFLSFVAIVSFALLLWLRRKPA